MMKNSLAAIFIFLISFLASKKSFSANEDLEVIPPCMQIKKACEHAGFQKGKVKEGKGLVKDCMQKLTNGEAVSGVSISASVVNSCKEKHEK